MKFEDEPKELPYTGPLRVVHRGGAVREGCHFTEWLFPKDGRQRAQFYLNLGPGAGLVACSASNGWCAKPVDDWRLHPDDQDTLLAWAADHGRRITKSGRGTGRKRHPRKPKVDPRQLRLVK